jgi:hypothetical protein
LDAGGVATEFFQTSRQTIIFQPGSTGYVDVLDVTTAADQLATLSGSSESQIEDALAEAAAQAVAQYRGPFLEGFYLDGCPEFEEWQLITQERLHRHLLSLLLFLVQYHEDRRQIEQALPYTWRCIELEPSLAEGQFRLLQLLAQTGEVAVALAQYDRYVQHLADELGTTPSSDLEEYAACLRDRPTGTPTHLSAIRSGPPFWAERLHVQREQPFVDRIDALATLNGCLDATLQDGDTQVVFVVGEAGAGKTMLVQEFIRRSLERFPQLVVAEGRCSGVINQAIYISRSGKSWLN